MTTYYCLFIILFAFVFIENVQINIHYFYKIAIIALITCIAGFRFQVGNDFENYMRIFEDPDDYSSIESSFKYLIFLVSSAGGNAQALFLVCSILTILPLAIIAELLYSKYFFTIITSYVFSYTYFESMNTVRQGISMTFFLSSVILLLHTKKNLLYFFLIVIASLFHQSALYIGIISWIIIFFTKEKFYPLFCLFLLVLSFIGGQFINNLIEILSFISDGTNYVDYLSEVEQRGVSGGLRRYILNIYTIIFIIFAKKYYLKLSLIEITAIKMFIIAIITYNLFYYFFAGLRLYWYFFLFLPFIIPSILRQFPSKGRFVVYFIFFSLFSLYTIVSLHAPHYNPYDYSFNITKPIY